MFPFPYPQFLSVLGFKHEATAQDPAWSCRPGRAGAARPGHTTTTFLSPKPLVLQQKQANNSLPALQCSQGAASALPPAKVGTPQQPLPGWTSPRLHQPNSAMAALYPRPLQVSISCKHHEEGTCPLLLVSSWVLGCPHIDSRLGLLFALPAASQLWVSTGVRWGGGTTTGAEALSAKSYRGRQKITFHLQGRRGEIPQQRAIPAGHWCHTPLCHLPGDLAQSLTRCWWDRSSWRSCDPAQQMSCLQEGSCCFP